MSRVVIIDADDRFAAELKTLLTDRGCSVRVFEDGPTALLAAAEDRPDVVVLSAELPRVNGYSICNKMKRSPKLGAVPIILVSARSTPETFAQHQLLATRAQVYLQKPVAGDAIWSHMSALVSSGPEPLSETQLSGMANSTTHIAPAPAPTDDAEEEEETQPLKTSGGALDALRKALNKWRSLAQEHQRRAMKLEAERDRLLEEKRAAEKRATDFRAGAKKMAEQLNQRARELRELRAEYETSRSSPSMAEEASSDDWVESLRAELLDAEKKSYALEANLEEARKSEREAKHQLRAQQEELEQRSFEEDARVVEHERALRALADERAKVSDEVDALRRERDDARAEAEGLRASMLPPGSAPLSVEQRRALAELERHLDEAMKAVARVSRGD
ncbi:MAG: response regulator [Myxococcota bacterium]